ncbi:hypothetical protein Tsubulata_032043 [Turnera subulata]|uniref:COBRA C-terminal domain-containing protein n=1 Tax=Turnera subulata TaxID=218843 RepID=A0A9Q0FX19_9ROSI|nr:hypothetical protein Tsubulata_032043 [Turnera subulata]
MGNRKLLILFLVIITLSLHNSLAQPPPPPNATCNGVFLSYVYNGGRPVPPTDPADQAHRFESTVTVLNNGKDELKSWMVFVGFNHSEILVSATNAVLADGTPLPASVGNGTVFAGFPETDLKTAIETAGDITQMRTQVQLLGTLFAKGEDLGTPLPANLTLVNREYSCPVFTTQGSRTLTIPVSKVSDKQLCFAMDDATLLTGNEMHVCCMRNLSPPTNVDGRDNFMPRKEGDLIIMYDVISTQESSYWAHVSISNHNPIGRLDNWNLSWEWMRDEFIYSMKGAYPSVVDATDCIFGRQGQFYKDTDFSQVLSCERRPTITDLPPTSANDTKLGMIPFCCRNGTLLPPSMDPSQSVSAFQMQVFKMPPYLNRTELNPPQNWKINGSMNNDYQCGQPVQVSPSLFPDSSGLPAQRAAVASWQVVCNITHFKEEKPKCCVSFSAFFNDSVVPCSTCACGCNNNPSQTCSADEPALLLPSESLLVPFDNRTKKALDWAKLKRKKVPNPLPCGDNCGVSINWHILTDYKSGWTARITLFNWGETNFADWFAAVQLDKAGPGFEKVYSFNGSLLSDSNNTVFMQGLPGLNYLVAETDGHNPRKDPRVPGSQQSVLLFTKKNMPLINVARGDGFPTKVIFNGEECALPTIRPSSGYRISAATGVLSIVVVLAVLLMQ